MEFRKRKSSVEICDRQRRRRILQIVQQWEQQSEFTNTSTDLVPTQNLIPDSLCCLQNIEIANSNDLSDNLTLDKNYTSMQTENESLQMDIYASDENTDRNIDQNVTSVIEVSVINETNNSQTVDRQESIDSSQSMDYVKEKLAEWAVLEKISHNSLKKLLALLKLIPSLSTVLPRDPRTLLQTTKQTDIRAVFPGEYHHFGLASSIRDSCNRIENLTVDEIAIAINIDGVPLFNSSTAALWPILGNIIPYKEVFMIGVYYGHQKPQDANIYLDQFVQEVIELCENGIIIGEKLYKFSIRFIICDAPAKSFILCVKGFSGFNSCTKCVTKRKTKKIAGVFPN